MALPEKLVRFTRPEGLAPPRRRDDVADQVDVQLLPSVAALRIVVSTLGPLQKTHPGTTHEACTHPPKLRHLPSHPPIRQAPLSHSLFQVFVPFSEPGDVFEHHRRLLPVLRGEIF